MWIVFHYPLLGLAYAPFFALEGVVARVGAWVRDRWRAGRR
jgi:hypothetical protein